MQINYYKNLSVQFLKLSFLAHVTKNFQNTFTSIQIMNFINYYNHQNLQLNHLVYYDYDKTTNFCC